MKVLVIKTSSLGDVIHTLPAITDATKALPDIDFTWVVEEAFADIPNLHPAINHVIPVALRRWRKNWLKTLFSVEFWQCLKRLRRQRYDIVIDAQGLLKSSLLTWLAKGKKHGLHKSCSRGKVQFAYHHKHKIATDQHAVTRVRQLFAAALHYTTPDTAPDYGISQAAKKATSDRPYLVFVHGTAWPSKQWPERYWRELAQLASQAGLAVKLPAGTDAERDRAQRICQSIEHAEVIPPASLLTLTAILQQARAVVAVDTGLAHLAAALHKPCVTIYGATDPKLVGTYGPHQIHLVADFPCAPCQNRHCTHPDRHNPITPPCYQQITPAIVWQKLQPFIARPTKRKESP